MIPRYSTRGRSCTGRSVCNKNRTVIAIQIKRVEQASSVIFGNRMKQISSAQLQEWPLQDVLALLSPPAGDAPADSVSANTLHTTSKRLRATLCLL